MTDAEALGRVEGILAGLCRSVGGKDHYRTVRVAGGRELGVDVFSSKNHEGHIRVHVFNVDRTAVPSAAGAPQVPGLSPAKCPACVDIPKEYPAHYYGPRPDKKREYFGFQWHAHDEVNDGDMGRIEETVRWLLQH